MSELGRKRIKLAAEIVISGLIVSAALLFYFNPKPAAEEVKSAKSSLPVKIYRVQKTHLSETLILIGSTASNRSVKIAAGVSEFLSKIHFLDGRAVKEGDLLFLFDSREEEAKIENLSIVFSDAKREFERYEQLKKANAVSVKEYDAQKTRMDIAEMELKTLRIALEDRRIYAPFSGTIGICAVNEGAYVKAGDELAALNDDSKIKVDFRVPEKYAVKVRHGMIFTATGEAFPNRKFSGTVDSWDSQIDIDSRTLPVRGIIDNPDRILRAGMLLSVSLELSGYDALTIPEKAVVFSGERQYIFKVSPDSTAHRQEVQLGRRGNNYVEVLSRLSENDIVITDGVLKAKDGGKVAWEDEK